MSNKEQIKDWWTKALLGEQVSAHPVFGNTIHVAIDGDVVTLSGEVRTAAEAEELVNEVQSLGEVDSVINHLTVSGPAISRSLQTVIAVFPDAEAAGLARQLVGAQKVYQAPEPLILDSAQAGRPYLERSATLADAGPEAVKRYVDALDQGKVLLVDRVPEDEAVRIISALEGTVAEGIYTLPPEPHAPVEDTH